MQSNNDTHSKDSYNRWTWLVALILALILLWMLLTGRGPTNTCYNDSTGTVAETTVPPTQPEPSESEFTFTATQNAVTSSGDTSNITWLAELAKLKALLSGEDLRAEGDSKNVQLTGTVDTEATKQQKGADIKALFGSSVVVDNQLVVKAVDSPTATSSPPAAVKLYFDTGKTTLPDGANSNLAAIIDWLKTHPEAKAVLSGYHDSSGNKAANEKLAKSRAESIEDLLEAAGIDDDRIDKRKPESVDGGTDLAEARRVEVSIE